MQACRKPVADCLPQGRPTAAAVAENDYDIHHLFFNLHISDTSAVLSGSVTTSATVVAPQMTAYVFELDDTLIVDSVIVNGQPCIFYDAGQVRTANLPYTLPRGALFNARVYYHGHPKVYGNHSPG